MRRCSVKKQSLAKYSVNDGQLSFKSDNEMKDFFDSIINHSGSGAYAGITVTWSNQIYVMLVCVSEHTLTYDPILLCLFYCALFPSR